MKPFAHLIRPTALVLLFVGTTFAVPAQDAEREQMKEAIDEHRSHIRIADSTGDARGSARYRIMLAPMVKAAEAKKLYEAAAAIADSAGLVEDEELRARQGLVDLYRTKGNWRSAYMEAAKIIELTAQWQQRQALRALEEEEAMGRRAIAQRDSVLTDLAAVRSDAALQLEAMRDQQEAWKWALIVAILIGSLLLVAVLWSNRRSQKRMRVDIETLRTEVAARRGQPQNRVRERPAPSAEDASRAAPLVEPPELKIAKEPDRMVLDIFRSVAPERLRTLQHARANGDTDKVVRVVHTLKPQLAAIDAGWFGPICASITAPQAADDRVRWSSDLDRLEQAMQQLLG